MKRDIHPVYVDAIARCTCGNTMTIRSTRKDIHVERCSRCHPAYSGGRTLPNVEGRIARFRRRYSAAE